MIRGILEIFCRERDLHYILGEKNFGSFWFDLWFCLTRFFNWDVVWKIVLFYFYLKEGCAFLALEYESILISIKSMIESGILMNHQFVFRLCKVGKCKGRRQIGRKMKMEYKTHNKLQYCVDAGVYRMLYLFKNIQRFSKHWGNSSFSIIIII